MSPAGVILAIDPGPAESGYVVWNPVTGAVRASAVVPNEQLRSSLRAGVSADVVAVAIEQIEPRYGLSPGWETLDTARWVGRFEEAAQPTPVARLKRSEVLRHLGVVTRGPGKTTADSGVRSALLDRFGGSSAKGTKAHPGSLYGIHGHLWAALAVAVTFADQEVGAR